MKEVVELVESLTPIIWVRTIEEERFLNDISRHYKDSSDTRLFVHRRSQGRQDVNQWINEVTEGTFQNPDQNTQSINGMLNRVYTEETDKLKNVYVICNADEYVDDPMFRRRIRDQATQQLYCDTMVKVIVLVSHVVELPTSLARHIQVVDFNLPTQQEIIDYLKYIKGEAESEDQEKLEKFDFDVISSALKGLTFFEIASVCWISIKRHNTLKPEEIHEFKRRASRRSEFLMPLDKGISFDLVGGQDRLKEWLEITGQGFTVAGRNEGLPRRRGVMLLGTPGTGKSLIAKATCTEWGVPGYHFDPSRLFGGRVGESEARTRAAIRDLEANAPCVVFVDEMEKGFSGSESSGASDAGTTSRVVGTFLTWLQEHESEVFLIATVNDVTKLPPEMVQRFDELFFVDTPDDKIRAEIIEIHLKIYKQNPADFDLKDLAKASEKLVGREIDSAVKEALYVAFHQKKKLDQDILRKVFRQKVPLMETMAEDLKKLRDWVGFSEQRQEGIRARLANGRAVYGEKPNLKII